MTIKELMISVGFDFDDSSTKGFQRAVKDAVKEAKNMAKETVKATEDGSKGFKQMRKDVEQMDGSFKSVLSTAKTAVGIFASLFAINKIKAFASECVQMASDVEQMGDKFDVVFDGIQDTVDEWAGNYADAIGRNKNKIKTYLADQQNLLVGFANAYVESGEMTMDEARKWSASMSEDMTQMAIDIASFANMDEDSAVNNMTKAVMGQSEAAKALGAVLNDVTRAQAMEKMGLTGKYDALDQMTKMQVNYNAIMSQSVDAIGDAERAMGSYESQGRSLNATIEYMKEFIGTQLLPVYREITFATKGVVQWFTKLAEKLLVAEDGSNKLENGINILKARFNQIRPYVERFYNGISNTFQKGLGYVKGFVDKIGGMQNVFKILGAVIMAFLAILAFDKIMNGLSAIGKVLGFLTSPIGMVVAALTILILIVEDFIQFMLGNDSVIGTIFERMGINADEVRQKVFEAFNNIKNFLSEVMDFIVQAVGIFVTTVGDFFKKHGDSIVSNFMRAWGIVSQFLTGVWTFLSQLAGAIFGDTEDEIDGSTTSTKDKLLNTWQNIMNVLSAIWSAMYEVYSAIFNAWCTVIETVFGWIQSFWNAWGDRIISWFKVIWNSLGGFINGFLKVIKGLANFISSVFTGDWKGAWQAIVDIFTGLWEMLVSYLTALWETISLIFEMKLAAIKAIWDAVWNGIFALFKAIWDGIVAFFTGIWNTIVQIVTNIKDGAINAFTSMKDGISSIITSIADTIRNGLQTAIDFITSLPEQAIQWGADIINGLIEGIQSKIGEVTDAINDVAEEITSYIHFSVPDKGPLTEYQSWMPDMLQGLADSIGAGEGTLLERVRGLANNVSALMSTATAQATTAANSMINNNNSSVTQNVNINNSYSGGSAETQRNVSRGMKKSANDATTEMARALQYARG